jgi:hypothetical protein
MDVNLAMMMSNEWENEISGRKTSGGNSKFDESGMHYTFI